MRAAGTQESVGSFRHGDHACWAFAGAEALGAELARFVAAGVHHGDRVVLILDRSRYDQERLLASEQARGLVERGQLTLGGTGRECGDGLDAEPGARVAAFRQLARRARSDGWAGVRVLADNTPQVCGAVQRRAWIEYERLADDMIATNPVVGLCMFDLRVLDERARRDVTCVHAAYGGSDEWEGSFSLYRVDDTLVLHGEIDLDDRDRFTAVLRGSGAEDVRRLDLTGLDFIDINGAQHLMQWVEQRRRLGPLEVVGAKPVVRRIWRILGS